jgi:hypothetical protein
VKAEWAKDLPEIIELAAHRLRVRPECLRIWSWPESFSTTGGPRGSGGMTITEFQVIAFESYEDDARIKYCDGFWKTWDGHTQTW